MDDNDDSSQQQPGDTPSINPTYTGPGIEDPYAVKKSHDEYHPPVTNPPEEGQQGQEAQTPPTGQQSEQTPPSDVDQSAGGIITRPLTPSTAEQANTPVDQSNTPSDATGDKSSDLA